MAGSIQPPRATSQPWRAAAEPSWAPEGRSGEHPGRSGELPGASGEPIEPQWGTDPPPRGVHPTQWSIGSPRRRQRSPSSPAPRGSAKSLPRLHRRPGLRRIAPPASATCPQPRAGHIGRVPTTRRRSIHGLARVLPPSTSTAWSIRCPRCSVRRSQQRRRHGPGTARALGSSLSRHRHRARHASGTSHDALRRTTPCRADRRGDGRLWGVAARIDTPPSTSAAAHCPARQASAAARSGRATLTSDDGARLHHA